jgi:serine protease AprX
MELAVASANGGTLALDGSGWTRCVRTLAVGILGLAALGSGSTMATHAAAAAKPSAVVIRGQAGCATSIAATVAQLGGRVTRPLAILDGAAATVGSDRIAALRANPCVASVTADGSVSLSSIGSYDPTASAGSLFNTSRIVGAPSYWANGYTGKGVGVALIDSGVAPQTGLSGADKLVNGPDISFDSQSPSLQYLDGFGHGTHMAGIIAGRDGVATAPASYKGDTTRFLGIAPDATLVNVKVADAHGAADVSQILAGIDWTVQHAQDNGNNIRVINLSFGTDATQSYILDPLAFAAETAWKHGIVVVVAAGNGGNTTTSLTNPATDPFVIAVGADDPNNTGDAGNHTIAPFSSAGNAARSPDLVAPGVHIASLRTAGSHIDTQFGTTATVGGRFFLGSGTSQATAVVSGAAALILSRFPWATPDEVKYLMTASALQINNAPTTRQGHGELNLNGTNPTQRYGATSFAAVQLSLRSTQAFAPSTGLGSLDAARGSIHLVASGNGAVLSGEMDIMGNPVNTTTLAAQEATLTAWQGGTFNGSGWSGSGWSGSGWSGSGWSGSGWSGSGWSGSGWSGNTWTGSGWSGSGWSGSGWSGSGWSGSGWSGSGWSGSGWSGSGWSDADWS